MPARVAKIRKAKDSVRIIEESNSLSSRGFENKSKRGEQNKKNKIPNVYFMSFKGINCCLILFFREDGALVFIS